MTSTTLLIARWPTDSRRSHVNWIVLDSGWEGELCRVVEGHHRVRAYVKNRSLGLEVPYVYGAVLLDGSDTPFFHLVKAAWTEARMGMRLKAVWKPADKREGSFTDIECFEPTGEPDAAYESYQEFL